MLETDGRFISSILFCDLVPEYEISYGSKQCKCGINKVAESWITAASAGALDELLPLKLWNTAGCLHREADWKGQRGN
jgi:hypothetical protein